MNAAPLNAIININEIVNKFLLVGDKFIPEMHLKQSGLTCSACGPFTKNKKRIQRTASDKVLRDKTFNIAKNSKYDIKKVLLLWFINFLMKKPQLVVLLMKLNKINNWLRSYTNQLLKNVKKGEFILHLKTISGVLIELICY